ncbi:MAG: ABC transporter substrate binding protein [Telluria sp.]
MAIAATGDVASARDASTTVPVVFTIGGDPVRFGLVESFNRPGAHVTGVTFVSGMLGAKRVQLLLELVPSVARIALLMNPDNPNAPAEQADAQAGAIKLGREILVFNARNTAPLVIQPADIRYRGRLMFGAREVSKGRKCRRPARRWAGSSEPIEPRTIAAKPALGAC